VGGEDVTAQALTKVLNHVVTLRLPVDENVETKNLLLTDDELNLMLDELVVLLGSDVTLGVLLTVDTDLLRLGERTDGGGREEREFEVSLLGGETLGESRLAVEHFGGDLGLTLLDGGIVGAARGGTCLHGGSVGLELSLDLSGASVDGLGDDSNFTGLLGGKREPVGNLGGEVLL